MSQNKGILAACIVAALALSITIAGTATASPGASKAGKRCKKKHSAKRKCKKRKADARPSPLIRATLTWSNGGADDVDMDLFVFDANGNRAGNGSNVLRAGGQARHRHGRRLGPHAVHDHVRDGRWRRSRRLSESREQLPLRLSRWGPDPLGLLRELSNTGEFTGSRVGSTPVTAGEGN